MQQNNLSKESIPKIIFYDSQIAKKIKSTGLFVDIFGDFKSIENNKKNLIRANISEAFNIIEKSDDTIFELCNLLITDILCMEGDKMIGGGTASTMIGVICISPDVDNWEPLNYAESIVHEMIHLSLFIIDMVEGLYSDKKILTNSNHFVKSSIRLEPRPLDKSFHATCVVIGLQYFYYHIREGNKINKFLIPLKESLIDLNKKEKYFTIVGKHILYQLNTLYNNPNYDKEELRKKVFLIT